MKVTVDANALFACLIKDSATRRVFFNPALSLFAPEFIVDELLLHILEIREKSGLKGEELSRLIEKVFGQITLVPAKISSHSCRPRPAWSEIQRIGCIFRAHCGKTPLCGATTVISHRREE